MLSIYIYLIIYLWIPNYRGTSADARVPASSQPPDCVAWSTYVCFATPSPVPRGLARRARTAAVVRTVSMSVWPRARALRKPRTATIAEGRFVLTLANVRAGPQSPRGNHAPTAEFESALVELVMQRRSERVANSRAVCALYA